MTIKELMKKIDKEEGELISTSHGELDVFSVDENVHYGFLATGKQQSESIKSFLSKFGVIE